MTGIKRNPAIRSPEIWSRIGRHRPIRRPAVYFVRHGETAWTRQGRYQGNSDPSLTRVGVIQARSAARVLRRHGITEIVSSPLRRARRTSTIIARSLGMPIPGVDRRLRELNFGRWEGLTQTQVRALWPDQLRAWKRDPGGFRFPAGEALHQAQERLANFLKTVRSRRHCRSKAIVVVTHTGLIRLALLSALGLPVSRFREIEVAPGAVVRLDFRSAGGRAIDRSGLDLCVASARSGRPAADFHDLLR